MDYIYINYTMKTENTTSQMFIKCYVLDHKENTIYSLE